MSEPFPIDQPARDRFRREWRRNFAVSANAGSGKTTAISERLAEMALSPDAELLLRTTAVVTFTRKAAAQIGRRARQVLLRRLQTEGRRDLAPLDHLERAFFGTIHSFCLVLAARHGQDLGVNLQARVVEDDDDLWEEFLESDSMEFRDLPDKIVDTFLRHVPLDSIFDVARNLDGSSARRLVRKHPPEPMPDPSAEVLTEILAARSRGRGAKALAANQALATSWLERLHRGVDYLPLPVAGGTAAGIQDLFNRYLAPVKSWLAETGSVLAAELALRYQSWRFERGVQTYADQIETALALLGQQATLDEIRSEGWRVVLDEAQDTDPQQFEVLVEIARPPRAEPGTWPEREGPGPRPGHFCMVGDGQQAIYGSRADVRNYQRHLKAFQRGEGGECLVFDVSFRTPVRIAAFLNATLPGAFSSGRDFNCGLPVATGAPPPLLQIDFEELVAAPGAEEGAVRILPLVPAPEGRRKVDERLADELHQIAARLVHGGPAAVGARHWGEVAVLAPRNDWLATARKVLESAGLKTALQMRRNRNGDNPAYAWLAGLLAAVCDPTNTFEWVGVLREIFAVSDADIATSLQEARAFSWDDPTLHPPAVAKALETLGPFVERVVAEGDTLEAFAQDLSRTCGLRAKAFAADPTGSMVEELERLLNGAAELGLRGFGPREWLAELRQGLDEGRPVGKPADDAINLLTTHSAKGLEWPVVIPIGLWRPLRRRDPSGLRLIPGLEGNPKIYFDSLSLPHELSESREREWLREQVRLLYVALTRAGRTLVIPVGPEFGAGEKNSLLTLWGADPGAWEGVTIGTEPTAAESSTAEPVPVAPPPVRPAARAPGKPWPVFPRRILPHLLANRPDLVRGARHESRQEEPPPVRGGDEAIAYGVWWHEAIEFVPWEKDDGEVATHAQRMLAAAEAQGFGRRALAEWDRLITGSAWRELRDERWTRVAECGVFAPLEDGTWIDGVIDLLLHDPAAGKIWIVDWKTNRELPGEGDEALFARLISEYRPQLGAYASSLRSSFPGCGIRLSLYSTVAGRMVDLSE